MLPQPGRRRVRWLPGHALYHSPARIATPFTAGPSDRGRAALLSPRRPLGAHLPQGGLT